MRSLRRSEKSIAARGSRIRPLVAGLMLALAASGASLPTEAAATTHVVSNCLDSGFGSLRDTVGAATTLTNDVVDLSMLT